MLTNKMEMLEAVDALSAVIKKCPPKHRWELYARLSERLRSEGEDQQSLHFKALASADMTSGSLLVKKPNIFLTPPPEIEGISE